MKKILVSTFFAGLICMSAFLISYAMEIKSDGTEITINATAEPDSSAIMFITNKDGSIENNSDIFAIKQSKADLNGNISFSIALPEEKNGATTDGEYVVHLKCSNSDIVKGTFIFAFEVSKKNAIDGIRNGSMYSIMEGDEYQYALKSLGVNVDQYRKIDTAKREAALNKVNSDIDIASATNPEIVNSINTVIAIELLNENVAEIDSLHGLGLCFENENYDELNNSNKALWIFDYMKSGIPYSECSGFRKEYQKANCLFVINSTRFDAMETALNKYSIILEINESSEYQKYKNTTNKVNINEKIVSALKKNPAKNTKALLEVIKESTPYDLAGGGSSGGSGSSSSGRKDNSGSYGTVIPPSNNTEVKFNDIYNYKWAEEAILSLAQKGIVSGDGSGNFRPQDYVKREEFAKMIVCALQLHDKEAKCSFDDVSADAWYYSYVASAYKSKLAYGKGKVFGIGENITREDMAVMCYRTLAEDTPDIREGIVFDDGDSVSDYAKESVEKLYKKGIMNGMDNNLFVPKANATRAQAAVIIYNLIK